MKKLLLFVTAIIISTLLPAQVNLKRCGTFEAMKYKEELNPGYMARVNACFDRAKQIAAVNKSNRASGDTIYRIRMVFHVVYTAPEENIPDSVIYSQIEVLNEDYRRKNADTVNTRSVFQPVAADAKMEFYLANIDPDGNPTNGITRTAGSPTGFLGFEPFSDNVKSSATGGKDPWPTDRYLNVWVCNVMFGFGVLGYSFPPDNAPNWPSGASTDSDKQGVVLHFPVVGRNFSNPIDPTVDMGRSLVHELGHFFGLRHIWGDSTSCNNNDGMDDTPAALDAHQQTCDLQSNTCTDSPVDFPDMLENYMDYSDDRCLNMFTNDQVGVMRAMLQTSRAGLTSEEIVSGIKGRKDNTQIFSLFPNPSSGIVYCRPYSGNVKNYSVEIFNPLGSKILSFSGYPDAVRNGAIDLSAQAAGIYFAKISSGTQTQVLKFQLSK